MHVLDNGTNNTVEYYAFILVGHNNLVHTYRARQFSSAAHRSAYICMRWIYEPA